MARRNKIGVDVELPGTLRTDDPLFVSLLNERLRRLMGKVDELSGAKGTPNPKTGRAEVALQAPLNMGGFPITNVGTAKDSHDVVSLQQGNRRWLVNPKVGLTTNIAVGGGTSSDPDLKATFGVGVELAIAVANDITNHYLVRKAGRPFQVSVAPKTAPVSSALILDIKRSDRFGVTWTTIFGATKIVVPIGSIEHLTFTGIFASAMTFAIKDMLRIDCLQADGTVQDVEVVLEWQ